MSIDFTALHICAHLEPGICHLTQHVFEPWFDPVPVAQKTTTLEKFESIKMKRLFIPLNV